MPQQESEAVPEGNGPLPQKEEFGSGQPTLEDVYPMLCEAIDSRFDRQQSCFDRWDRKMDTISDEMRMMDQHVTSLEHGARQPRLAMEADGPANTKTRERTKGATTAVQAMHRDSCTTAQNVQDGLKTSISFGVMAEPPDLHCREDVLVEDGATSPESCLPSLEMRSSTAAGGLVPTGEASIATEAISNEPLLRFYATKETNPKEKKLWTSIPSAWYDSSFWKLLPAPSGLIVIETKPMQNRTFDPGGLQGHPRTCLFLGSWRALVCDEIIRDGEAG